MSNSVPSSKKADDAFSNIVHNANALEKKPFNLAFTEYSLVVPNFYGNSVRKNYF